jgi:hypothetical protein
MAGFLLRSNEVTTMEKQEQKHLSGVKVFGLLVLVGAVAVASVRCAVAGADPLAEFKAQQAFQAKCEAGASDLIKLAREGINAETAYSKVQALGRDVVGGLPVDYVYQLIEESARYDLTTMEGATRYRRESRMRCTVWGSRL